MLRHLTSCKKRAERLEKENAKSKCGYFQILIYGKYIKDYWLIIEINENSTLIELDEFLRDIWLECCGHLSAFENNGIRYEDMPAEDSFWGDPAESMNHKLKKVLSVGDIFTYEYDFGSTTELILSVNSYRTGEKKKENIIILSRNNPSEIICSQCETNIAQWVEPEGFYNGTPFWCKECLEEVEEDDEMYLLHVSNSPRMGVCAYDGSKIYPDQFEPDVSNN